MLRFLPFLCVVVLCGCGSNQPGAKPLPATSAFEYDQARQVISMDTRVAPPQRRRFDLGQGSVRLEMRKVNAGELTFHYTPEVEGAHTTYECTLPISATPVEIQVTPDGTPGKTSFDLRRCKVVKQGNLLDR